MKKVPNILVPAFQRNSLRLLDTKKLLLTLRKLAYINMSSVSCRYNAAVLHATHSSTSRVRGCQQTTNIQTVANQIYSYEMKTL